jgi:hypothetical protein
MRYNILIVFVSIIILSGCLNTEGSIELKGKIFDEKTKVKLPNRKVNVFALFESEGELISDRAGFFFTDSTGCFVYTLKKVKNAYLYNFCIVGDSTHAFLNKKINLLELERNAEYLFFHQCKLTDFAINIERKSKRPFRDTLYLSWESDGTDGEILYPYKIENYWYELNNKIEFIGGEIKPIIKTKVYADKRTIIHYKLYRDGKYIGIYDTIFCLRDAANIVYFRY